MTESRTRTRMKVLAVLVLFMFAALTTRLWFLQVLASQEFSALADQNQVRFVPIEPLRGQILDRRGKVLVSNRASTVVVVDRLAMKGHEDEVLSRLSRLLGIPVSDILNRLNSVRYLPYQPVPVAEDVAQEKVFAIREHPALYPGVSYELAALRDYPQGKVAAHILGYTGEISQAQLDQPFFKADGYKPGEIVGKAGVEAEYERFLQGTPGKRELQVDAKGKVLNENFNIVPPKPGDNLVLSMDLEVQKLAEESLAIGINVARNTIERNSGRLKATGGAVVVMDPNNGQVLALASNPTYDPSIWSGGLNTAEAHSLDLCGFNEKICPGPSHNLPLLDRGIQASYPPGSTFKPFVAMAALKDRFATQSGTYPCPSEYTAPGDTSGTVFHNWDPVNRGYIPLSTALVISCDTVFYGFGWRYWVSYFRSIHQDVPKPNELMQKELNRMGFGNATGIDLPAELSGRLPTPEFKTQLVKAHPELFHPDERTWLPGDYINMSIGQGFMLTTPMQLAVAYSAIANGGTLYAPRLGLRVQGPDGKPAGQIPPHVMGKLPLSKRSVGFIREALRGVPERGTASSAFAGFPLIQVSVAGKTGTADIAGKQPFSWFAAMAPVDHPKYVVVVMVEQGGHGSTTAAPIARRILEGLFGLGTSSVHLGQNVD
jgi:penicillin-binding protein 2